eukprot:3048630-Pyramimonas_sp.AAC.1
MVEVPRVVFRHDSALSGRNNSVDLLCCSRKNGAPARFRSVRTSQSSRFAAPKYQEVCLGAAEQWSTSSTLPTSYIKEPLKRGHLDGGFMATSLM